jgi:hypothetical protein
MDARGLAWHRACHPKIDMDAYRPRDNKGRSHARGMGALVDRAHDEFCGFWQGTFVGLALSAALWTMLLGLGSALR